MPPSSPLLSPYIPCLPLACSLHVCSLTVPADAMHQRTAVLHSMSIYFAVAWAVASTSLQYVGNLGLYGLVSVRFLCSILIHVPYWRHGRFLQQLLVSQEWWIFFSITFGASCFVVASIPFCMDGTHSLWRGTGLFNPDFFTSKLVAGK